MTAPKVLAVRIDENAGQRFAVVVAHLPVVAAEVEQESGDSAAAATSNMAAALAGEPAYNKLDVEASTETATELPCS